MKVFILNSLLPQTSLKFACLFLFLLPIYFGEQLFAHDTRPIGEGRGTGAVILDPNNGGATVTVAYSQSTAGVQLTYTAAGNGTFTLTMPAGVTYIPGSVSFVSSAGAVIAQSNISNLSAPVFSITGATVGANSVISYGIRAGCATQGSASIGVSVTVAASTTTGSISISILKAALTIDAHNTPVTYVRGGASSANITITNGGNGSLDSILFFIKQNSLLVTDSVKANGQLATFVNTVGDTLFYRLRSVHFPGGTLDNGESIVVTRYFRAPACYNGSSTNFPSFQSVYFANFGRNNSRCQSPTPTDFGQINFSTAGNGDPTATVVQLGIDRLATPCQTALVRYRYTAGCTGNAAFCNAYNVNFLIWNGATGAGNTGWLAGEYSIKSVKLVSNNASIPVAFTNQYFINLLNSSGVQGVDPDGAGVGLEDLDADGYYDDIVPGQTFDIEIEWERLKPAACANNAAPHRVYVAPRFSNQCGQALAGPQVFIIGGNLYPSGSILMLSSPTELGLGQTGTTQTQINRTAPNNTYLSCPTNQFSIRFPVAPGMTVTSMRAGTTNLSFSVVSDTAVALIPATGISNPFICEVDFNITPGVTPSGVTPKVILAYECTSACPNAREDVACLDAPPIIIPMPGPCPDGGASTSNSSILRMTTGFTNYQHTTRVPLANITLPSRKRGLPCDTVLVSSTGTVNTGLVITGGEPLYYQVSYSLHGGANRLFNWVGGTYTYQSTTNTLPTPIYEANNGGSHIAIYSLGAFPAGAVVNIALYGIGQDAATLTNTLESVPGFGNIFFNLDNGFSNPAPSGDTRYSCSGQSLEYYVRNPRGAFVLPVFATQICDNHTVTSRRYYLRGTSGSGVEVDYFPGEIRPMIVFDSIVVTIPTGWTYVPGGDVLKVWGNASEGNFPGNTDTGVSQNIGPGTVSGNKVKWVNPGNWNVPDDALRGGFELSFTNDRVCTVTSASFQTVFYGRQNANTRDLTVCPPQLVLNNGGVNVNAIRPVFTVTNLSGTQTADQRVECFNFNLNLTGTNGSTVVNAPFTYIYFPGGGGNFTVTSFKNTTTNVSYPVLNAAGGQWVQLGLLQNTVVNGSINFPFTICAEYASCTNPDIQYIVSWGCDGYPTNPAVSGCSSVSGFFDLAPVPSGLQAQFIAQPVNPVTLCTPLVYDFNTLSTLAADLVDPRLEVQIPTGMSLSSVQIEYPYNSGNFETVTPAGTTGTVTIPYGLHSLVNDSLPGVGFQPTVNPRTGRMRLSFVTDCSFTSGDRLLVTAKGDQPCGQPAQGNNTVVYSDPIDIAGVTQNYVTLVNNLNIGPDTIITCENRTISMDMVMINTSAFPVNLDPTLDSVKIDLPAGIQYVAGSYNCTSGANCFLPPLVSGSSLDLTLPVPTGITIPAAGSVTVSFSLQINALVDGGCNVPGGLTISMVRSFPGVGCASQPGGVCPNPVKFITGSETVLISPKKANVSSLTARVCRTTTNNYDFTGTFNISQGAVPSMQSVVLEVFCLSGGNPVGAPVATRMVNGLLNMSSGNIPFSGSFNTTCAGEQFQVRISPVTNGGADQCVCSTASTNVSLSNPTFTVTTDNSCAGDVQIQLPLNSVTNGGNQYKVNFDDPSITDITTATTIPANGILLVPVPSTLATNTYTGTVTVINNTTLCEGNAPFNFIIHANPTIAVSSTVCVGGTTTVMGSGTPAAVNPYVSSNTAVATVNSAGVITGVSAGTANITYKDVNGCTATATIVVSQISAISFANTSGCNNNGTASSHSDDYFTADITVNFSAPPATGNLELSGDVLPGGGALSVPVATIGSGPTYTFTGVRLKADNTASSVTATFSSAPCTAFAITNGPATNACVTPSYSLIESCRCFDVEYNLPEFDPLEYVDSIKIISNPGETWAFISHTGLEVPDTLVNIPLAQNASIPELMPGMYGIRVSHTSGVGYSAVIGNGVTIFNLSNLCTNPSLTLPNLANQVLCQSSPPFDFSVITATLNGVNAPGTFTFDIVRAPGDTLKNVTSLDPSVMFNNTTVQVRGRYVPADPMLCPHTFVYNVSINNAACPCELTINSATASVCDPLTNTYTLTVNISYDNAPTGENILVATSTGASMSFTPVSTSGSETFVLTGLVSNATAGIDVFAKYATTTTCGDTIPDAYNAPANCTPGPCSVAPGTLGGSAFNDINNNGINNSEAGVAGIQVRVYDCNGNLVGSTFTDANGDWNVAGLTNGDKYRVEFIIPPSLSYMQPSQTGTGNGTSVQFVTPASCDVDFGMVNPDDYCQNNPMLAVPRTYSGPQNNGLKALVGVYNNTAESSTPANTSLTNDTNIGTTWGIAYQKSKRIIYTSSMVRHYFGYGPGGFDAIYAINFTDLNNDLAPAATTTLGTTIDLGTLGVNMGADPRTAAITGNAPYTDGTVYQKVGKAGLGDIDISTNGDTLFAVNLNSSAPSLVLINVQNPAVPTLISEIPMPAVGCTGGAFAPWALKYYQGHLYIGGVCTAETSGNVADLDAYVYRWNGGTSFTQIATMDMNYPRSAATFRSDDTYSPAAWRAWTNTWNPSVLPLTNALVSQPQPMLQDIEFDTDGSMVLGFGDRFSYQTAYGNRRYDVTTGSTYFTPVAAGDIIKLCKTAGGFVKESTTAPCLQTISDLGSTNLPAIPDFVEYYDDNYVNQTNTQAGHAETILGGLVKVPGTTSIVAASFDPIRNQGLVNSSGLRTLNSNGTYNKGWILVQEGDPDSNRKGGNMGDIEALCNAVPIQIGNYVWVDTDKDGVQDPCEIPLSGVKVELYKTDGTLVGQTTTGANGEYYFDQTNVDSIAPYSNTGPFTGLSANTGYYVVVGKNMSQFNTSTNRLIIGGMEYALTTSNNGVGTQPDQNDSDGTLLSGLSGGLSGLNGYPAYLATTPGQGSNHTFDFGFAPACLMTNITLANASTCNSNGTVQNTDDYYTANITVTYTNAPLTGTLTLTGDVIGTYSVAVGSLGSTTSHTFTNVQLVADGTSTNLTAMFSADALCTYSIMGPAVASCSVCATPPSVVITETNVNTCGINAVTFNYTVSNGPATLSTSNGTLGNFSVSTLANGTGTFTYTPALTEVGQIINLSASIADPDGSGPCLAASDAATVTVQAQATLSGGTICVGSGTTLTGSGTPAAMDPYASSNPAVATVTNAGLVTGVSAGNTTITYTDNNGCQATATVTVNAVPTLSGGSVCIGNIITLTGSGTPATTNPYVSSDVAVATISSTGVVTGISAGTAIITYTNNNGCQTTATVAVNAAITPNGGTICEGATLNLTGSGIPAAMNPYVSSNPAVATVSNTGVVTGLSAGTTNITYTSSDNCQATVAVTVQACCTPPTAKVIAVPGDCVGAVPGNNGRIVLMSHTGADRFGFSLGNTYTGPNYAGATAVPGTLPGNIVANIPNTPAANYVIRIFGGSNICFTDYPVTVSTSAICPTDPMGYVYCQETGQIIAGGTISVSGPSPVLMTQNGASGIYQFFTDGTAGTYTLTYTPPAGYTLSTTRLPLASIDPTGQPNPYFVGSGSTNGTSLDNFTAGANPYTFNFVLAPGDPEIQLCNIPLAGCCVAPTLTVTPQATICAGSSFNLATLVLTNSGTSITYHTTLADAQNGTNPLATSVVSPVAATNYYIRSNGGAGSSCSSVKEVTLWMQAPSCGTIQVTGPH